MSAPPRTKQLTVDTPDDVSDWFAPFLAQLNEFVLSVTSGLQNSLNRSQNFASQRYTLEFETGPTVATSFPIVFNCTLSTSPEEVRVTQARVITQGGTFSGAVTSANWELAQGAQIKIHEITGLSPNTKYQILFTVT